MNSQTSQEPCGLCKHDQNRQGEVRHSLYPFVSLRTFVMRKTKGYTVSIYFKHFSYNHTNGLHWSSVCVNDFLLYSYTSLLFLFAASLSLQSHEVIHHHTHPAVATAVPHRSPRAPHVTEHSHEYSTRKSCRIWNEFRQKRSMILKIFRVRRINT